GILPATCPPKLDNSNIAKSCGAGILPATCPISRYLATIIIEIKCSASDYKNNLWYADTKL
ncbi:MAG: hypothetical protein ACK57R_16275, partial [Dolichospermum sp.]